MTRYQLSHYLEIEKAQGDDLILVHQLLGNRLQVNRRTEQFLRLFVVPRTLEELASSPAIEQARPSFERLLQANFLIEAGYQETISDKVLQRTSPGFFGAPLLLGETPADVVFLGVPFDYGNHKEPGARFGPTALRMFAANMLYYTVDHRAQPQGWYDNRLERPILAGVRLADAGNLFIAPNENPQRVFAKLGGVLSKLLEQGSFPVVLGGDHSITYASLSAFKRPLAVLQIDAHSDLAPYQPSIENHHGNVMSRALQLPQVTSLYQVGIRGTTPVAQALPREKVALCWSPRRVRQQGVGALLAQLPTDVDWYVSLDIDALDPIHAPGTSTPVPGGFSFEEVQDLLTAIAEQRRCIGFDLVEINPKRDSGELTVATGVELLLAFLGGLFTGRKGKA